MSGKPAHLCKQRPASALGRSCFTARTCMSDRACLLHKSGPGLSQAEACLQEVPVLSGSILAPVYGHICPTCSVSLCAAPGLLHCL